MLLLSLSLFPHKRPSLGGREGDEVCMNEIMGGTCSVRACHMLRTE